MTPREIHIAIDLGLQKLGSFAYDNIKPEYIDYAFNRMGDAYITEKTTKELDPKNIGFEDTQSRLSMIRELIEEEPLTVYNEVTNKRQHCVLPWNYFTFIEAESEVISSCNNTAVTYTTTSANEYISTLSFKQSDFGGTPPNPPFANVKVYKVISGTPTEIFDFADFSDGLDDIEEIFTVKNKILDEINRTQTNIKVYWEKYRDEFLPDTFIFVSSDSGFSGQSMRIDYTASLTASDAFSTESYTKVSAGSGTNFDELTSYCRLLSNEETYHMMAHPFGTTSSASPILNILGDKLAIYINERFILKGLTLKYIRKPQGLSLPLNQSYGIQDSRAIAKIVDMTVEYLLAAIESQGLQALAIQNQKRD